MPRRTKKFARMMKETLTEYPQQTTIHGVKYLGDRSSPIAHRIYWIIIFIISFSLLGNFVYKMGQRWLEKEVVLIDESLPRKIYEIPFPAITICPQIKFKMDQFDLDSISLSKDENEKPTEFEKKLQMATNICGSRFKTILDIQPRDIGTDFDWLDTLQDISPSREGVFDSCHWMSWLEPRSEMQLGLKSNCRELFSMILTNEGVCFTFNTIRDVLRMDLMPADFQYRNNARRHDGWDPDKGYTKSFPYPHKAFVKRDFTDINGLGFILNAYRSDITDFCKSYRLMIPNVGYKIVLHSPTEYPQTHAKFISLEYGKKYRIEVIPKMTRASIDLISVPPKVRGCYFNEERKLKYYTFYNENNCRLECFVNFSRATFNNVPVSLPRDSNDTLDLSFRSFRWEEPEFNDFLYTHFEQFGVPDLGNASDFYRECKCLPACNSISYGFTVIEHNENDPGIFGYFVAQTAVVIVFNEPTFIGQKRVRLYTFDTMLSDFGGLLGLFIGGSMLSLFELFYFCIIRNYSKWKEHTENLSHCVVQN